MSLIKHAKLFGDNIEIDSSSSAESLLKNEDVLFVGSLILKLYKISDKNSQQIPGEDFDGCKYSNDSATCHTIQCCSRGACIVPLNSLINHSCDPNVKNVVTTKQKFIVYTLVPIKKDCQVTKYFLCAA